MQPNQKTRHSPTHLDPKLTRPANPLGHLVNPTHARRPACSRATRSSPHRSHRPNSAPPAWSPHRHARPPDQPRALHQSNPRAWPSSTRCLSHYRPGPACQGTISLSPSARRRLLCSALPSLCFSTARVDATCLLASPACRAPSAVGHQRALALAACAHTKAPAAEAARCVPCVLGMDAEDRQCPDRTRALGALPTAL